MTPKQQHMLLMYHRISVMGIDTQRKVLTLWQETTRISWYCERQNLGTQWSVNVASGSVLCVHIQKKLTICQAKLY